MSPQLGREGQEAGARVLLASTRIVSAEIGVKDMLQGLTWRRDREVCWP
jgi:hypothetical protein